jgi:hypothetical protein
MGNTCIKKYFLSQNLQNQIILSLNYIFNIKMTVVLVLDIHTLLIELQY